MLKEVKTKIIDWIVNSIVNNGLNVERELIKIEHPSDMKFGDYSTNIALIIAKREKLNPLELAEKIKKKLDLVVDKTEIIEQIEVAAPGFINFYLKKELLLKLNETLNYQLEYEDYLRKFGAKKTMVIDYSAPNIAKPFGIGHLRSTNIGQSIYNIYKIIGWNTIGDNHIGDWGTQYGKLMAAIKHWGEKEIEKMSIDDLEKLYVRFHQESETNPVLIDEGREWFAKLENGDPEAREMWKKCIDISINEFDKVYNLLNVKMDHTLGESFYEKMLEGVIGEVIKKDIARESQGALIVEFDNMPPAMIKKTNGTTTYLTRDLATIKYRMETWKPDLIIYEVGADQVLHFKQVFEIAKLMNWKPTEGFVHIAHGLIRWKSGKFSTRKGDTIHLSEVIDKALDKASEIANKSLIGKDLPIEEKQEMIKKVAIGAIKFNDLSSDPKKDIVFDWDQIMSLEGDSGPYLQYTYARCQSVLRKTKIKEQKNVNELSFELNTEELEMLRSLYKLEEKIIEASERFSPAVIAEFILEIARKYNEFYSKHRIIDQKEEVFRIFLTKATANVLSYGLKLLGIETIERM